MFYSLFKEGAQEDTWKTSKIEARSELQDMLSMMEQKKIIAKEINYKVKKGIELNKKEDKFLGIIKI